MSEILSRHLWRDRALQSGLVLMWTSITYWAFVFPLNGMHLFSSNRSYGNIVSTGFFLGISTLVCGLIGKGRKRWVVVAVAFVETLWWWLMAVGA